MADGGFAVKFDRKMAKLCYSVAFDHDEWQVKYNDGKPEPLPKGRGPDVPTPTGGLLQTSRRLRSIQAVFSWS